MFHCIARDIETAYEPDGNHTLLDGSIVEYDVTSFTAVVYMNMISHQSFVCAACDNSRLRMGNLITVRFSEVNSLAS